ncbi:MAG: tyrosine-type recombinase/integrase [Muribaculaceae bacterium]|nr:tyrosine-type recombinase/integrase [Muribaculaceae bacterium]
MVGLTDSLTTYVMRHSWATIARNKGIGLSVISEALGHDNEATTQIYLDSISTNKVDEANRSILDDL